MEMTSIFWVILSKANTDQNNIWKIAKMFARNIYGLTCTYAKSAILKHSAYLTKYEFVRLKKRNHIEIKV